MTNDCEQYSNEKIISILKAGEELNHLKDVDTILDKILYETRKLSRADAGSIFLAEGDKLNFSYVHNDTLFQKDETNAALYADYAVPIDETSIVGNAALTGETILIEDAYHMPADVPYAFNPSYDRKSGYKTASILAIPLKSFQNRVVGVMQLINAKDEQGRVVPFSHESRIYVPLFASSAALAIERGIMNRDLILRMMKMTELRDPSETGAHVQRVGAYAAEIYQKWAIRSETDIQKIKHTKDLIRLAAMLHDIGKVGIPDAILKKPGKLTPEEFNIIKWHPVYGARLFIPPASKLDEMCRDIALNHHEKWDGRGYPGRMDILSENEKMGIPKKGEEIPLVARITALADVFDALGSKRSYKEAWPDEKILATIEAGSGTHFDPELVEIFFDIFDVIQAIREKFRE